MELNIIHTTITQRWWIWHIQKWLEAWKSCRCSRCHSFLSSIFFFFFILFIDRCRLSIVHCMPLLLFSLYHKTSSAHTDFFFFFIINYIWMTTFASSSYAVFHLCLLFNLQSFTFNREHSVNTVWTQWRCGT